MPANAPNRLFEKYKPEQDVYDEMREPLGFPRAHWESVVRSLDRMGATELQSRADRARRIIRENGITYNVYADSQGIDRPWELDVVPLIIPPAEWKQIESALIQRTRLYNLILSDLYGPQRLLHERILPPALVHANPSFLRPCHGAKVAGDVRLFMHAVDLARSPNGRWWVLADRTQAPSGVGYALENRIVLSRILADEFRDGNVQRLARFFQVARDTLRQLAPRHKENPNVVLLTPGPYNETYFEQAYLARYLGFTLVEGSDLTVRDRTVFIKTLEGLQPVDVILRRVDDTFCDPLELRAESILGVPGLVEAVRAGNVTVANSLGSGLVETPALAAFLPGLCRRLLGEELGCPSVATWWCGQPKEREYVVNHLESVVLRRAFPHSRGEPIFGGSLTEHRRKRLLAEIRANPHAFLGQEQVALSTAPVWTKDGMMPRPLVMRAFVASTGDGYMVMPGGLTRVSTAHGDPIVSMQQGGGSKDTWVISDEPVTPFSLIRPSNQQTFTEPTAAEVPSRVADDLFWLGRYAERLEGTLRVLRHAIRQLTGEASAEQTPERSVIVRMLMRMELLSEQVDDSASLDEIERELLSLVYKANRPVGVRGLVGRIRHITSRVRDRLSADTWRIFTRLIADSQERPHRIPVMDALQLSNTLIVDLAAFSGLEMENMTRGHGWRFLNIGRRLERAMHTISLAQSALASDPEAGLVLESLLEIADSVITYRRRHFAQAQLLPTLLLLLKDGTNPRSLEFQLNVLSEHATHLPVDRAVGGAKRESELITRLLERLNQADFAALTEAYAAGEPAALEQLFDSLHAGLWSVSESLAHHYFTHTASQVSELVL